MPDLKNACFLALLLLPFSGFCQSLDSADLMNVSNWQIFDDADGVMESSHATGGVQALYVENDSNYWVATGGMVHQVIDNEWTYHDPIKHPSVDSVPFNVTDIFKCPFNDHIWFSSRYYGFRLYDGTKWVKIKLPGLPEMEQVEFVREDKHSNVLVSGWFNGSIFEYLFNLKTKKVTQCTKAVSNGYYCEVILNPKGQFVTVRKNILTTYKKGIWKSKKLPDGLTFRNVVHEMAYTSDTLWAFEQSSLLSAKESRLCCITKKGVTVYDASTLPPQLHYVRSMQPDLKGRIWFATLHAGFLVFDGKNWSTVSEDNTPMEGVDGAMDFHGEKCWFGTDEGVFIYGR